MPIIECKAIPDSMVYLDSWKGYNALDLARFSHARINKHFSGFTQNRNHINCIEHLWSQAKAHLRRFNGAAPRPRFGLYLKKCEC